MKKSLFLIFSIFIVILSFAQIETDTSSPVAIVNGEVITSDFLNVMADLKRILTSVYTIDEKFFNALTETPEGLAFLQKYRLIVLNELIDQLLTQQIAKEEGLFPGESEVQSHVSQQISTALNKLGVKEEEFEKYLATFGMTLDDLKRKFAWLYITNKCLDAMKEKVTRGITVSEKEIEDYYKEHYLSQEGTLEKEISLIVTNTGAEAKEALSLILSGKKFEDVAAQLSMDKETAKNGGKLGKLNKEKIYDLFGDEVGSKIWKASENAILGPYKVGIKWVIVKVGKIGKSQPPALNDIKDEIEKMLLEKKKEQYWKQWWEKRLEDYRKRSNIKILLGG